jgi:PadR family transcriptional regulator, regulatory protein PadR
VLIESYEICLKKGISYTRTTKIHKEKNKKMTNIQKEVQVKLTKGLIDMIVLQLLKNEPMHGYQIITNIRKNFGVYLGPSTVYPMLGTLEKKGYVTSQWNMNNERPRKVYTLTTDGQSVLTFTEGSLNLICRTMTRTTAPAAAITMQASIAPSRARKTISTPAFAP